MLDVRGLNVSYGAISALKGVSLSLAKGEIVTLIGANGAGKSTTLRTIMGLVQPSSGDIHYRGASIVGRPTHQVVREGMTLVPEGRAIFGNLTVRENLLLGAFVRNDSEVGADLQKVFEIFPRLKERIGQNAGTLKHSHRAYVLETGSVTLSGPSEEVAANPKVKEAYLGE